MSIDPRKTIEWKRLCQAILPTATLCWICRQPLDHEAPPRSRWSPSLDHRIPVSRGGAWFELENLVPAHYGCNSRKRDHLPVELPTSRDW